MLHWHDSLIFERNVRSAGTLEIEESFALSVCIVAKAN